MILLLLTFTSPARSSFSVGVEPEFGRPENTVYALTVRNTGGSPLWEVRFAFPSPYEILDALPPEGWGYAIEKDNLGNWFAIFQALEDHALIRENGIREFELTLGIPAGCGESLVECSAFAKDTEGGQENVTFQVGVDGRPPTVNISQRSVFGLGKQKIEIRPSENLASIQILLVRENLTEILPVERTENGFQVTVEVIPGFENLEPELVVVAENTFDRAGNKMASDFTCELKVDTMPPLLENLVVLKEGREIRGQALDASGVSVLKVELTQEGKKKAECIVRLNSHGSLLENSWRSTVVWENGCFRILFDEAALTAGKYIVSLQAYDGAFPPNVARVEWVPEIGRPRQVYLFVVLAVTLCLVAIVCFVHVRALD